MCVSDSSMERRGEEVRQREKGESSRADPSPTCNIWQSMNYVLYTNIYSFHICFNVYHIVHSFS